MSLSFTTRGGLAALCATLALSASAMAEDLQITQLHSGSQSGRGQAGFEVAYDAAEFRSKGLDQLLDPAALANIDWSQEMAIAVFTGGKPTGGYGIQVTRASLEPQSSPVGTPGHTDLLTVFVDDLSFLFVEDAFEAVAADARNTREEMSDTRCLEGRLELLCMA